MWKTILGWALAYIKDGKRLTAALIALIQLLAPYLRSWGIELPEGATENAAAWAAVVILNLWSKANAVKTASNVPALTPPA